MTDQNPIIAKNLDIEQIEAYMLSLPQAECPVQHFFSPGLYIRQVVLPQGIIAIGHKHKYEHLNIMLTGKVAMIENGQVKELKAPQIFTAQPGRKIGYIIETCVWLNIYKTDEADIGILESELFDKSEVYKEHENLLKAKSKKDRQIDVDDYNYMLSEYGFLEEVVREQSENEEDQVPFETYLNTILSIRNSSIEGKGLFLSFPVLAGTIIAPARINGKRTPAGRYINHSKFPNCEYIKLDNGDIYLVALHNISGCKGGNQGEELTVNYRQALALSGIGENKCLQ